jgi:asparagine synthase (glutamine-hydrolysing)
MCGIAGLLALGGGQPPERRTLEILARELHHRGPDDEGFHLEGPVGLAMRRLSILDVEGGAQPVHSEDGGVTALLNGEIYNFRELRQGLLEGGHRLRSSGDTEVLVHLYEDHGLRFLDHLRGMFALALWDRRRRRMVLARDPLGIKPLFHTHVRVNDRLLFASELGALLATGEVPRRLDHDALGELLAWEYVPSPHTLLRDVHKLPAGHCLVADATTGTVDIHPYRCPPPEQSPENTVHPAEAEEELDHLLGQAVAEQLVSDVPLGALLSGGVDSSLVVHHMARRGPVRAFSLGFADPTYDESQHARTVARHLGVEHTVEVLDESPEELLDHLLGHLDDPIADTSIVPTYQVCRLARRHVKVVLTGDGGDELFGGYETYLAEGAARLVAGLGAPLRHAARLAAARIPPRPAKKGPVNKARRFLEGLGHDPRLGHARWRLFAGAALQAELFAEGRRGEATPERHVLQLVERFRARSPVDRALAVDLSSYLVDNCLVKVDRMSMACSLEARVPLLDERLVDFAFRLPPKLKVGLRRTKVLLKRVARRHLPRGVVERP